MPAKFLIVAVALAATSTGSVAQDKPSVNDGVIQQNTISLMLSNSLASAALDACSAIGQRAVVAIIDRGGNLVALQRGDNVGPHNTIAAQRKAFTALSTKSVTADLTEKARNDPASQNLNTVSELLLLGGGVPIVVDGEVIGAVGVAGAGGSANDESCAKQGVEKALTGLGPK
ncbi:hypothetical protein GCM10011335_45100 [Aureimonas glaciei]|uniref:Heme-binding protein n=1 Tax=Aureimonas glaciei TaxID=1776957 RepID=A0A916YBG3_9HYPH|nr:hypothetical protein GCM10011335_45100 [Aureimonas glaciei]